MSTVDARPIEEPSLQGRGRQAYGSIVLGAILVVIGALWLLHAVDLIELEAAVVLPAVLAVVGIALIIGSFGGSHSGLVVFGAFLTVAVVAAAVTPLDSWRGGVGDRRHQVNTEAELAPEYRLGIGDLRLDLRDLDLTSPRAVTASVGAGTIRIVLPRDLAVTIDASVGAGEIDLLGERSEGLAVTRTFESPGFTESEVTLSLTIDVSAGEIEVTR